MAPEERNIRLLIEYNGAEFYGWQRQDNLRTVQGSIESAFEQILGASPTLTVAGRTDSGVHAIAQVANFRTQSTIEDWKFAPALNRFLPPDISIHRSEAVPPSFNSKTDSLSKRYRYRVYHGPRRCALDHHRCWFFRTPIDANLIREATGYLVGTHDFESFRNTECDAEHAIREIFDISVVTTPRPPVGEYIDITFHGNAYCRHMCRILAGTLVEVGLGKRAPEELPAILEGRSRSLAGQTAPAVGLTLLEVRYP